MIKPTLLLTFLLANAALAQQHKAQPYAGLDARPIASLSERDLQDLRAGRGWGLALPAELNGVPGPTHLLEHAQALGLSEAQREALEDIRSRMTQAAVAAGADFIDAERALSDAFADGAPDADTLAALVQAAAQARGRLRLTHLAANLETVPVLQEAQIAQYNALRGYDVAGPCDAVPEGHAAAMWRRHNGCE
ncbi:hypothetical protein C8N43_3374 [Litoreibacter ponti]|uniref:LTXXQ motif family protein n=1 Tax=Litoreibacter ponti TaxID=1510457 RepID=A0A2T6BES2_9RHOB|nr:hypothetical protein [Litoreibacter ponti]PTX54557.1 hypothetical protein C8N43_3374 [Litoreibacter ponti]